MMSLRSSRPSRDFSPRDEGVFRERVVGELLDIGDLLRRERCATKIEREFVRTDV